MKKKIFNVIAMVVIAATLSSCATVFGGRVLIVRGQNQPPESPQEPFVEAL